MKMEAKTVKVQTICISRETLSPRIIVKLLQTRYIVLKCYYE